MNNRNYNTTEMRSAQLIRAILTLLIAIFIGMASATAQTVREDANGDLIQVSPQVAEHDSITGRVYRTKTTVYKVFKGKRGGLYYWRKAKTTGNWYKSYPKIEKTISGTL